MTTVNGFGEWQTPFSVKYGAKINQGGGAPLTRRIPRPGNPGMSNSRSGQADIPAQVCGQALWISDGP